MASKKELKALITLAGKVDPSLQASLMKTTKSTRSLSEGFKQSTKYVAKFSELVKASFLGGAIASGVSILTSKVMELGKESIQLASDLVEVQNVVDTTFGQNASQIDAWAKTTLNAYGITELQAKQWSGSMGAMLKSSNIASEDMLIMSTNLAGLAGDMASFYNLDHDNAWQKIRSGIAGESEPLKELGINMSVANLEAYALAQGIKKSFSDMSQAEQTLLRYNYLMEVSADAQGDFARTSDSFSNQQKLLTNNIKQLSATIASKALPFLTKLYKKANEFVSNIDVDKVLGVFSKVGDFIQPLIPHIESLGDTIKQTFIDIMPNLSSFGEDFATLISKGTPPLFKLIESIVKLGGGLINFFLPILMKIGESVGPILIKIGEGLSPLLEKAATMFTVLGPLIGEVIGVILSAFDEFMPLVDSILQALGGVIDFITGVFTGDWQLAWQGVVNIFSGMMNGLKEIIVAPINFISNIVNGLIGKINEISIPEWVPLIGGKSLDLPMLPTFARGGIATQASIFGEAGPEIAIPLKRTSRSFELLNQTAQILGVNPSQENSNFKMGSTFDNFGVKEQTVIQKTANITIQVIGEVVEQTTMDIKSKVKEALEELEYEEGVIAFG
ncbi:MAG: hypothetical protein E6590_11760 [Clostridiales bacterium]|nr:hypothetical protein [Clostridiales bacterium]